MKKLIIALCLILGQFSFAQEQDYWMVETSLMPYVKEYIEDAKERNSVTKAELIGKIDYIYFAELGIKDGGLILGMVGQDKRGLYVSSRIKDNPIVLRLVVYHEIGHILKQNGFHSCKECYNIMSSGIPLNLDPFAEEEVWDALVDEYFEWVKFK